MNEYYFILSSSDKKSLYTVSNLPCNYRVKLYKPLMLDGAWEMGLVSCLLTTTETLPTLQLVQSSMCESQTVIEGRHYLPVVKHLVKMEDGESVWNFDPPTYVAVNQSFIETVELLITGVDGVNPSFNAGTSTCVLHLRKCP